MDIHKEETRLQRLRMVVRELNANKAKRKHQNVARPFCYHNNQKECNNAGNKEGRSLLHNNTPPTSAHSTEQHSHSIPPSAHFGHFTMRDMVLHPVGESRDVYDVTLPRVERSSGSSGPNNSRPVEKVHQCEQCGYATNIKTNLITHMRTHSGEKPFICEFCEKAFSQKSHLKRHSVKLHRRELAARRELSAGRVGSGGASPAGAVGRVSCNMCAEQVSGMDKLVEHMKVHHSAAALELPDPHQIGSNINGSTSAAVNSATAADTVS